MKKGLLLGCLTVCCAVLVLGFGANGWSQQKAGGKWPPMLRVSTPSTQSSVFACTNGWGPKMEGTVGMKVRVIPEDSEVRRFVRFTEGKEFDLHSMSISDMAQSAQGEAGYAGVRAYPARATWHIADTPWGFVVRGDSKFKTIYDLKQKGVRVALSTQSPPMMMAVKMGLPAFIGWTPEEAAKNWSFIPVGSYAENCRSVTDGKADVSWVSPVSSVTFEMEAHPQKIRWLQMPFKDKEAWKRWLNVRPTTIPLKLDWGVPSAQGLDLLTSNFIYWTRADQDQEFVYQLTKWFHEQFNNYKDVHNAALRMALPHFRNYLDHAPLPVAEGTIRYLKEIKQWTPADDKWNNEAIKLMDRWVKARNAALDEAKAKGVKIHWEDKNYRAILDKHTAGIPLFRARL